MVIHKYEFCNPVFTQPDTETDRDTDKKWLAQNCVEVFILHRDGYQRRFPLGSVPILSASIPVSVSLTVIVNTPYLFQNN